MSVYISTSSSGGTKATLKATRWSFASDLTGFFHARLRVQPGHPVLWRAVAITQGVSKRAPGGGGTGPQGGLPLTGLVWGK